MEQQTKQRSSQTSGQSGAWGNYPVDNQTYDLLQTLTSKLEAIEAYQKYMKDSDQQTQQFFQQMMQQENEHARKLLGMLKQRFQGMNF
ncbi:MAG TPA: ferritin family protein [Chloroflexota bacterium]